MLHKLGMHLQLAVGLKTSVRALACMKPPSHHLACPLTIVHLEEVPTRQFVSAYCTLIGGTLGCLYIGVQNKQINYSPLKIINSARFVYAHAMNNQLDMCSTKRRAVRNDVRQNPSSPFMYLQRVSRQYFHMV